MQTKLNLYYPTQCEITAQRIRTRIADNSAKYKGNTVRMNIISIKNILT